jgi:hypothetical protein
VGQPITIGRFRFHRALRPIQVRRDGLLELTHDFGHWTGLGFLTRRFSAYERADFAPQCAVRSPELTRDDHVRRLHRAVRARAAG